MKSIWTLLPAALVAAAAGPAPTPERFVAVLDGDHASPAVITPAGGVANFTILGDTAVMYDLRVARLKDVWSAGLYSSAPSSTGFKAITLYVGGQSGEVNGTLAEGTLTSRDTLAGMTVKELAELMRKKQTYVEIRTAAHPTGELRGQVIPAEQWEKKVAMERSEPLIY